MNKMLPLVVLAVVMLTFSYAYVYAERSVVEVPFDYTGHGCTFDQESVTYTCSWQGSSETVTKESIVNSGVVDPEQIAEESKEAHEDAKVEIQEEIEKRTPTQKKIDRLIEQSVEGTISSADRILLDLLVDMKDSCELGIEHGALIQSYAEFELPISDPRTDYKAINFKTNWQLGKIIQKIEECKGWDKYRVDVLGQRYLDIVETGIGNQQHHSDMVTDKGTYPSQKLTEQSFDDSESQATKWICESSLYSVQFRNQHGCESAELEKYPAITDRTIASSTPMKNFMEYMATGFVDVETLKKTEVKKANQQSLESFAQRHGIDIADLKNLVQNVDEYNKEQTP